MKKPHKQVWVKVNCQIDEGMVELVGILNRIQGLQTIESCQGYKEWGFVYFEYGGWREVGKLVFEILAPPLLKAVGEDVYISINVFNCETPRAELRFRIGALEKIASILKEVFNNPRNSRYFYDKYHIRLHSC